MVMHYQKQSCEYKGRIIRARRRRHRLGLPYYYALICNQTGGVLGEVERDGEGGISSWEKALELAKYEIDQGYHDA